MLIQVPGSAWSGRARCRALASLAGAVLVVGCAIGPVHVHRGPVAADHLEYLARALEAPPAEREELWRAARTAPEGDEGGLLRAALLRTIPGHSGYDPAAAEGALQALLGKGASDDVAAVARARLQELRAANACRQDVKNLERRLSKVVDIERQLDQQRR